MKKFLKTILIILLFIPFMIKAEEKQVNMYLFYGNGCPHCRDLEKYLNSYIKEKDNVKLYKYEVWYNEENANKLKDVVDITKVQLKGVPYLVIGNIAITGYSENDTPERIRNAVNYYENIKYEDKVGIYLGLVEKEDIKYDDKEEVINNPDVSSNMKKIINNSPLIISTIVIALVDGFNPCAMWILLFLISMLIGMKDKKRKWILGIVFLVASGFVYFLFLISILNLVTFLDKIVIIRIIISLLAIIMGFASVIKFVDSLNKDDGCTVVKGSKRKKIINSIKRIIKEKSFIVAVLGIILLAFSVNIIELLCSLGLPVVFTELLTINKITGAQRIIYSIIYVLVFLLDDILVFIISMKTLELKAVSNKFGKYAHLVGGIIMILIGFLMAYKPEWLMLNF